LPGNVLAFALDASGDWCYIAVEEDGVYAVGLRGQGVPRLLHKTPLATALALSDDGRELFIAERSQIWRVANVVEAPETSLLADLGEAEFDPVALVADTKAQRLYVAAQKSKLLISLNTADATIAWRTLLDFEPAGMAALTDQSLFALNAGANAGGPIQVLQTGESPAVYFVPAGREDSGPEE
jgi:hypothetical protein